MTSTKEPTSSEIRAKHRAHVFPSVANYYQESVVLDAGSGSRVKDLDGRTYLDFFGGILTVSLGHAHPRVTEAVVAQVQRLGHVSTLYPTVPMVTLAEKLTALAPGKIEKAFFSTSGTEANETAIALAQIATGRTEVIALRHGYSGRSMLGQTLTGNGHYRALATQVAAVKHAHAPYCYRCPFGLTYPSCDVKCAKDVEELIQTTTSGGVAAFLGEPIQGVGGFIVAPPGYWSTVAEIVRRYGGLLIADEVQTGLGRTGEKFWGIEHHGVDPDIITMAKGVANGLPLGVTLATAVVADAWTGGNISTFGGNPISAAAANATVDTIVEENLASNAESMGRLLREGLNELQARFPKTIGDVRGMGLMQALELVVDEAGGDRTPAPQKAVQLFEETKKRGLLIGKGGLYGNSIRIAPALNVGRTDVEEALNILKASFEAFAS